MKHVFVLGLMTVLAAPAFASFEMALVADQNNGGRNWIHRYDVDSGVYLGRFDIGNGSAQILSMQLLPAQGRVSVGSVGSWREFDIWTGEMVREVSGIADRFVITDDGTRVAYLDNAADFLVYTYPTLTGGGAAGGLSGGGYRGGAFIRNTYNFLGMQVTVGGAQFTQTTNLAGPATLRGTVTGTFTDSRNIARVGGSDRFAIHNGSFVGIYPGSGAFGTSSVLSAPVAGWTPSALAEAHTGNLVLGRSAGVHGIARYGVLSSVDNRYFTTTQVVSGTHMAAFLAPEPGTMAALGLGVVGLLRRKRSKKGA